MSDSKEMGGESQERDSKFEEFLEGPFKAHQAAETINMLKILTSLGEAVKNDGEALMVVMVRARLKEVNTDGGEDGAVGIEADMEQAVVLPRPSVVEELRAKHGDHVTGKILGMFPPVLIGRLTEFLTANLENLSKSHGPEFVGEILEATTGGRATVLRAPKKAAPVFTGTDSARGGENTH